MAIISITIATIRRRYAGISWFQPTALPSTFALLDAKFDDGDLSSGKFRLTANGRYTYILDE